MLTVGATLGGRYRVTAIGSDAVELSDLVTGGTPPSRTPLTAPLASRDVMFTRAHLSRDRVARSPEARVQLW